MNHLGQYQLPMLIAENGMALRRSVDNVQYGRRDNLVRSQYLREHVRVVSRLAEQGHQLIGYLHWSLFDNYEWGSFTPRFGLYSLDYAVYPDRQAVDASGDNASATYALEIQEAQARLERAHRRQLQKQSAANAENLTFGPAIADSESTPHQPFTIQDNTPLE